MILGRAVANNFMDRIGKRMPRTAPASAVKRMRVVRKCELVEGRDHLSLVRTLYLDILIRTDIDAA